MTGGVGLEGHNGAHLAARPANGTGNIRAAPRVVNARGRDRREPKLKALVLPPNLHRSAEEYHPAAPEPTERCLPKEFEDGSTGRSPPIAPGGAKHSGLARRCWTRCRGPMFTPQLPRVETRGYDCCAPAGAIRRAVVDIPRATVERPKRPDDQPVDPGRDGTPFSSFILHPPFPRHPSSMRRPTMK